MTFLRLTLSGRKLLVKRELWLPCTYRFQYKGCAKEDCIYFGLDQDKRIAGFLPNKKDWARLSRDYVRHTLLRWRCADTDLDHRHDQLRAQGQDGPLPQGADADRSGQRRK